jgi:hypothetical protein
MERRVPAKSITVSSSRRRTLTMHLYGFWKSVLGPSLFLFFTKDMPEGIKSIVRLFADDTIAYLIISSESDGPTLQINIMGNYMEDAISV